MHDKSTNIHKKQNICKTLPSVIVIVHNIFVTSLLLTSIVTTFHCYYIGYSHKTCSFLPSIHLSLLPLYGIHGIQVILTPPPASVINSD